MTLSGFVVAGREPIVSVKVLDRSGEPWEIDAVVDTGFDGTLSLPSAAIEAMNLLWIRDAEGIAADDAEVSFNVYRATVIWVDGPLEVEIIELGQFALIGMKLLQDTRLTVDVCDGGQVKIEPLSPSDDD